VSSLQTLPAVVRKKVRAASSDSTLRARSRNSDGRSRYGVHSTRRTPCFSADLERHGFRTWDVEASNFDALE
jgi:hypothetical protein